LQSDREWSLDLLKRRRFLQAAGVNLGAAALAMLGGGRRGLAKDGLAATPHFPPKAKSVVYLQMTGGPSQFELFDYKPKLQSLHGQDAPARLIESERFAFLAGTKKFLGSRYKFARRGRCGAWVSELLPHIAKVVDEVTIVKSVQTDQFNHGPAQIFLCTGTPTPGRPSIGAWATYGLGSEASDLPGYVVLVPAQRNAGGRSMWGCGFLPAKYQGVELSLKGEAVPFVADPPGVSRAARRDAIDVVGRLNRRRQASVADPQIAGAIAAYETAFRMQASAPELMRIDDEPRSVLEMYGADDPSNAYARACLLARRLVERGVRFVQICYEGEPGVAIWDSHGDTRRASLEIGLPILCQKSDRPTAALILDLKQRGLLGETLVVWGGEFGRTPMNEDRPGAERGYTGRDHWPKAGVMLLAGGGVKAGFTVGETDEIGYDVVEDPIHVHDLNATILHLLGLDHERLTYRFQGRDFRLTDVHGRVASELLA
jgi:hypothetical protein